MNDLDSYYLIFPNLPIDLIEYFSFWEIDQHHKLITKNVKDFCIDYHKKNVDKKYPQANIIAKICDILVDNGFLNLHMHYGTNNEFSSYYVFNKDFLKSKENLRFIFNEQLNCIIYGFKFIYEKYKSFVLPVEYTNKNEDISIGSCFIYSGGIVTARHCIEGAKKISIKGINSNDLKYADFLVSTNPYMDILFIKFKIPIKNSIMISEKGEILDEVITMGYPRIPGFHNFLTTEKASIAFRFTASKGEICSEAKDIWIGENLFLITAKIRGGNSGGPVIKKNGGVVGISINIPEGEGNYDDLGYGTVVPIHFLNEIIFDKCNVSRLDVSNIEFVEFY